MQNQEEISRREFLGALGAGAVIGTVAPQRLQGASGGSTPPPVLKNPNILVIMVDQLRPPMWLSSSQSASLGTAVLPNIVGRIQNRAYNFQEFYVAATACIPSRSCLLTGLYAPQTAKYLNNDDSAALNPAYPTWGEAMATLNQAYQGNVWWFGKWHLSQILSSTPLLPYGFNARTYPGGVGPYNPSPNGAANEGANGGPFHNAIWASDAMIAGDFIGWLQGQASGSAPWCATVSLINPHDITFAPAWLQSSPFPPTSVPLKPVYFSPPSGSPPSFFSNVPSPWNYENLQQTPNKPGLQAAYVNYSNKQVGAVTDWVLLLNQYFWLQSYVDAQVGHVLDALQSSPFANNTIIVFLSDHGEFGGSHGMHTKGFAVYDEAIRVPFYVQFPGQTASFTMSQMCSAVDLFGLICDLATGGSGVWRLAYPDLGNRQSIWSFLYRNSTETRVLPGSGGLPYVLHTFDETAPSPKSHIVCLRTKNDPSCGTVGAKLAFYSAWNQCATVPNSTPPDPEFYDYNPQTTNNTSELGNDYYSNNATTQATIEQYTQALGSWAPAPAGIIGNELNAPLGGTGTDGNPLTNAQSEAREAYFTYVNGSGVCP